MADDRIKFFYGSLEEIEKAYNKFLSESDNIDTVDFMIIPTAEFKQNVYQGEKTHYEFSGMLHYTQMEKQTLQRLRAATGTM